MADVTISYNGSDIATMSASGTKTLETQGKYCTDDITVTYVQPSGGGQVAEVVEKDVNFIDYDGTLLYSYTASEFANLTAMPANPSHTGLTAQGWNWTLTAAKSHVAAQGKICIGQSYTTSDGKTRIYIHLDKSHLSPTLGLGVKGNVDVDWGDGSAHSTLTGTSVSTLKSETHTYASAGDYIITLTPTDTIRITGNSPVSGATSLLYKNGAPNWQSSTCYSKAIYKVEVGSRVQIYSHAFNKCYGLRYISLPTSSLYENFNAGFYYCYNLEAIVIPAGLESIGSSCFATTHKFTKISLPGSLTTLGNTVFSTCYARDSIIFPNGMSSFGSSLAANNYNLTSVIIPSGVTSLPASSFASGYSLSSVIIPSGVTSIASKAFENCYSMKEIHFKGTTPPTVAASDAFTNLPSDCVIYVPTGYLNTYKGKTNYPDSTVYTYQEEAA